MLLPVNSGFRFYIIYPMRKFPKITLKISTYHYKAPKHKCMKSAHRWTIGEHKINLDEKARPWSPPDLINIYKYPIVGGRRRLPTSDILWFSELQNTLQVYSSSFIRTYINITEPHPVFQNYDSAPSLFLRGTYHREMTLKITRK